MQVEKGRERRMIIYDLKIKIIKSSCEEKDARRKWSRELRESEGKPKEQNEEKEKKLMVMFMNRVQGVWVERYWIVEKFWGKGEYMRSIEATEKRVAIDGKDTKSENYKGSSSCSMSDEDTVWKLQSRTFETQRPRVDDYGWKEWKKVKGCRGWPDVS